MKKNHSKNIFYFMLIFTATSIFLFSNNLIQDASAISVTATTFVRPNPPTIISLTASNPNNNQGYSNGDTITVRFSNPTNEPPAATKSQLDALFTFSQPLGNDYTGSYTDPSTLVITIVDKGTANPTIGVLTLTVIGGLTNAAGTSLASTSTSPALTGSFESPAGPYITSIVADDPNNNNQGYSNGDTITVRFSSPTNEPGGTGILDNSTVSSLLTFSQKLGRDSSGQWINPLTFMITINDITGNGNPRIGVTTVQPSGQTPIKNFNGTSLSSSGISPVLAGSFGTFVVSQTVSQGSSAINTLPSGIVSTVTLPSDSSGTITVQEIQAANNLAPGGGTIQFIGKVVDITPSDGATCLSGCTIAFTFTTDDLPAGVNPQNVKIFHDANHDGLFADLGDQLDTIVTEGSSGIFTATATVSSNSAFGMGTVTSPSSGGHGGGPTGSPPILQTVTLRMATPAQNGEFGGILSLGSGQTRIVNTGEPVKMEMQISDASLGSNVEHVSLYMNLPDSEKSMYDSDTYVLFEKGYPLVIVNKSGLLSNINVDAEPLGPVLDVTLNITFAKPMEKSDIIIQAWNYQKYSSEIRIPGALEAIVPIQNNISTGLQNETQNNISTGLQNETQNTLMQSIENWAGYSLHPISDSELLGDMGIKAQHIPSWVAKPVKWLLNDQISEREFVSVIKYLYEHGMIK